MLNDAQLERLFQAIRKNFPLAEDARRTFEFLPSSLRPGQLELARHYGYNRLSCGVQTASETTLAKIRRTPHSLISIGEMINDSFAMGFDEINLDLMWGLEGESNDEFMKNLRATLALQPTSVTIHKLIYRTNSSGAPSPEDELRREAEFRRLGQDLQPLLDESAPGYVWVHRPNCAAVVQRAFHQTKKFNIGNYSDNERVPLDTLGLGRFARSRIMGECVFSCSAKISASYDPDEPSYEAFKTGPEFDATLDIVTALLADGRTDMREMRTRYGRPDMPKIDAALAMLASNGVIRHVADDSWEYLDDDHVFVDSLQPLVALIMPPQKKNVDDKGKGKKKGMLVRNKLTINGADWSISIFIDKQKPGSKYYSQIGSLGLSHSREIDPLKMSSALIETVMNAVVVEFRNVLTSLPDCAPAQAVELIAQRFAEKGDSDWSVESSHSIQSA